MRTQNLILVLLVLFLISCGSDKKDTPKQEVDTAKKETVTTPSPETGATKVAKTGTIDLKNKGIGPIKSMTLNEEIDEAMATKGAEVFKAMCTACHRVTKKFIGPNPTGVLERRSPEWVMNMILNPEEMTQKDPIARQLLIDYNGSPMANQNLTEEDARAVLEYFRTLK